MRSWSSLYQGSPIPAEGAMFKKENIKVSSSIPTDIIRRVRYWDLAATKPRPGRKDPDWTVGALVGLAADGKVWLLGRERMRGTPGEVKARIAQTAKLDGPSVEIWIEQEPGSSGVIVIDDFKASADLRGYYVQGNRETGSKVSRALPLASQTEVGKVWMIEAPWNRELLDEFETFPYGIHDDQVDAASGGFSKVALGVPAESAGAPAEEEGLRAQYGQTRANYGGRTFGGLR